MLGTAQLAIFALVWMISLPIIYFYTKSRIVRGRGTMHIVLLALALVSTPLIPAARIFSEHPLLAFAPWMIGFSIACLPLLGRRRVIATRARSQGLPESRLEILPTVGKVSANIIFNILIVTWGLSALIYNLGTISELYNPFGITFSMADSMLFHVNHALKGMLFDIMEVFDLNIQNKLQLDAKAHPIYGVAIALYRMFCSFAVFGAIGLMVLRYLGPHRFGYSSPL